MVVGPRELLAGIVGLGVAEPAWPQAQIIRSKKVDADRSSMAPVNPLAARWCRSGRAATGSSPMERIIHEMAEEHGRPVIK
jgi:hypothetical protein